MSDEMHTSEPDKSGKVVIEKESIIKVINTTDNQGILYLPLFTDWEAIGKYISQLVSALVMPAEAPWLWVLNMGEYHGAIINPAQNALSLSKEQTRQLLRQIAPSKMPKPKQ